MQSRYERFAVKAIIAMLPVLLIALAGYVAHRQGKAHTRALNNYLEKLRPTVVEAIEAYKVDHAGYPDNITNAIAPYYEGPVEPVWFWEQYQYQKVGTNYALRHFESLDAAK